MAEKIIMPKLGFNMSVGKLIQWYKHEGDPIKKGEPIFSIETDKTSIDIEANRDGVFLKKFIEEGDTVEVTLPIAIIGDRNENIDNLVREINGLLNRTESAAPPAEEEPAVQVPAVLEVKDAGMVKITPRARRVAKENGLDPKTLPITGTGYQGGICEKDILDYLASNQVKATPVARKIAEEQGIALDAVRGSGVNGKIMKQDLAASTAETAAASAETKAEQKEIQYSQDGKEILEVISYSGVRKIIGDRLSQSKFTSPHLYFTQKVNLDKLLDFRKQINAAQEKKTSVTDYVAKACVITLQKYTEMNASLVADKIVKYKTVNLGIAVAAPSGLIVPVVKDAEKKSLLEISKDASALFDKARMGKLSPAEYSGGTFTVSNLGMFGIENFTAIINPPEVGILAVSATKDEPLVITDADGNKSIAIKPMMNITLSVDHRVIDGLLAAQFVTEVKRLLENPIELFI